MAAERGGRPSFRMTLRAAVLLALATGAAAQVPAEGSEDEDGGAAVEELSLEELMDVEVTIASRSKQRLSQVPAAVYVITGDEIRRSGHATLPEVLRMVPGFYVSHWTTGAWDVTSRGFGTGISLTNLAFLNQLLVLIDGVVVYSPLFGGVWWPLQDVDLRDVERIEIVRGPGGVLWGSHAVHGVVHVITKDPANTQGVRVSGRAGRDDRQATVRHGGTFGENGRYRVFARVIDWDTHEDPFLGFDQDWWTGSAGFRADWERDGRGYTVWGRAYDGERKNIGFDLDLFVPIEVTEDKHGVQLFWGTRNPEERSQLQAWYTTDRQDLPTLLEHRIDQLDVEYQRELDGPFGSQLVLGGGYRIVHQDLKGEDPFFLAFDPEKETRDVFRVFGTSRTPLADGVDLVLGLAAEHNDFTGVELQPTARLSWWATENTMVWGGVTRAVRTPTIEENDLTPDSFFVGNDDFKSEVLWAYELGARRLVTPTTSIDVALFYNDYDRLHYESPLPSGQFLMTNDASGHSYGAEVAFDARPFERWRIRSAYTYLEGDYEADDGTGLGTDDVHPRHVFNLRSYLDLAEDWELDGAVYVVEDMGPGFEEAEYVRLDLRLGWQPRADLELFAGVQSLNEKVRSEFDEFDNIRRSVYAGLSWTP